MWFNLIWELWTNFSNEKQSQHPRKKKDKKQHNDVNVELSASKRVGFHQYTFPKTNNANIILDLVDRVDVLLCDILIR